MLAGTDSSARPTCRPTEWAVLSPSYTKHFPLLARLVRESFRLAQDVGCIRFFGMLSTGEDVISFRRRQPAASEQMSLLSFDDVLLRRANTNLTYLLKRQWKKGTRARWCWSSDRRVTAALKKFYGLIELHHMGFSHAWVLDCESVPLRTFSFGALFREFAGNPRILAINMSNPMVRNQESRYVAAAVCTAEGLKLMNASQRNQVPPGLMVSYHVTDYWFYALDALMAMVHYVETVWSEPFAYVFSRNPASEYFYYGLFNDRLAYGRRRHTTILLPESLDVRWPENAAVPPQDFGNYLFGKCHYNHTPNVLTFQQRLDVLKGPAFSWIHGYRFDLLDIFERIRTPSCSRHAEALLRELPDVTWATSNFKGQVNMTRVALGDSHQQWHRWSAGRTTGW